MKMAEKMAGAIELMLTNKSAWWSPTEIGHHVGGFPKHSSYGSPICKKMVELGLAERNDKGNYKLL